MSSLSRRELIQLGVCLSAGMARHAWAAQSGASLPLITKAIPSSGEKLPVIGLGTIWFREAQYDTLKLVLKRMQELGGSLIDTAAAYGESEGVIGRALQELGIRSKMFIATKFDAGGPMLAMPPPGSAPGQPSMPPPLPGPPSGVTRPTRDGVGGEQSFERSLKRLSTDQLDLLQVHNMNDLESLMPLLQQWKRDKKVRYIGVTTSNTRQHDQLIEAMDKYPLDFIQVDYSLANRDAAAKVLPAAREHKVAVLANLPLGRATELQRLSTHALPDWAQEVDVHSWGQLLLKYVVSHPAVTCAIPGSTKVEHLEDNQAAGRGRLADAAMRTRMEQYWANL